MEKVRATGDKVDVSSLMAINGDMKKQIKGHVKTVGMPVGFPTVF